MAKQKDTPLEITLKNSKSGKEKTLEIAHWEGTLIELARTKKDKEWILPDGYEWNGKNILKK